MTLPKPALPLAMAAALAAALTPSAFAAAPLTTEARAALEAGIADEYRAEAFYAAVMDKFGAVRPFANIIRAERVHASAIAAVMKTYGIAAEPNPYLGDATIAASVPATLGEACAMGVAAEIENRDLYQDKLIPAVASYPDIKLVFEQLGAASQNNHLPAFQRCAAR